MTARQLMVVARACLAMGVLGLGVLAVQPPEIWPGQAALHGAGFYLLALAAFAAFPSSRRADLALGLMAGALCVYATLSVMGRAAPIDYALADVVGVAALHVASHLEAMRRRMRDDPWYPAFAPAFGDRRRGDAPLNVVPVGRKVRAAKT